MDDDAPRSRGPTRTARYVVLWVAAAAASVTVGLLAVSSVGASVRDRGPIGVQYQAVREAELREGERTPDPAAPAVDRTFDDVFGSLTVRCQGAVATGRDVSPAAGWRVIAYETGPDDDIDVVVASGVQSVEVEVFCNQGRPTVADREVSVLPAPERRDRGR